VTVPAGFAAGAACAIEDVAIAKVKATKSARKEQEKRIKECKGKLLYQKSYMGSGNIYPRNLLRSM
jgi:hypothetical protein